MAFGFVWELMTKRLWTIELTNIYYTLSPVVIVAWGVVFVSTTYYAEYIKDKFNFTTYFIPDLISSVIGLGFEYVGFKIYDAWRYKPVVMDEGIIPILDMPWVVLALWPVVVLLYNNFIRVYDPFIESWFEQRQITIDLRKNSGK